MAIISAVLLFLGFILSPQENIFRSVKNILQVHFGSGDNIAGDKITNLINQRFLSEDQGNRLLNLLVPLRSEFTNVGIIFFRPEDNQFAKMIDAIFKDAGWQTNFTSVAQGPHNYTYPQGIEVFGYNPQLTKDVANSLRSVGLTNIQLRIENNPIDPDNPKWPSSNEKIEITIGY